MPRLTKEVPAYLFLCFFRVMCTNPRLVKYITLSLRESPASQFIEKLCPLAEEICPKLFLQKSLCFLV